MQGLGVVPGIVRWELHNTFHNIGGSHGLDQQIRAHQVLIVNRIQAFGFGVLHPHGSHDRHPSSGSICKHCVPIGQQSISCHGSPTQTDHCFFAKHPRLTSLCVVVRVATEKWSVGSRLHPSSHQLGVGIPEKSTNIGTTEGDCPRVQAEEHRSRDLEVGPLSCVITSPDGSITLSSSKEGTTQNEWAQILSAVSTDQTFSSRSVE
mmetsp:Transcript_99632/g.287611  ORF Transcript_99632/g.287611 Transcript_99632/m.287611 type:complete len:206 (-) Transcript_99632:461-1078(-)